MCSFNEVPRDVKFSRVSIEISPDTNFLVTSNGFSVFKAICVKNRKTDILSRSKCKTGEVFSKFQSNRGKF